MKEPVHLCSGPENRKTLDSSKAAVCLSIVKTILAAVEKGRSADSALAELFRSQKRFGSHDRRFLSDTIFAFFRAYEPLKTLGMTPAALFAARRIEGLPVNEVDLYWADELQIDPVPCVGETPYQRLCTVFRMLNLPVPSSPMCFIPLHLHAELSAAARDERFAEWIMKRPVLWLRANHPRPFCPPEKYKIFSLEALPGSIRIDNQDGAVSHLPELMDGSYEIQDLSSQCIGCSALPEAGESWLDACAGAGGKSLQLSAITEGKIKILAAELYPKKLDELKRRAERAGFHTIRTVVRDSSQPFAEQFDGVLVDAPCSSSGRWRRNPDARISLTTAKLDKIVSLQRKILDAASQSVKPGGVLIYATCSVFHRENRDQVLDFLKVHPDFHAEPFPHPLNKKILTDGMLETMPWSCNCDASFAARLRRSSAV